MSSRAAFVFFRKNTKCSKTCHFAFKSLGEGQAHPFSRRRHIYIPSCLHPATVPTVGWLSDKLVAPFWLPGIAFLTPGRCILTSRSVILVSWGTILLIRRPPRTPNRTPWGPDLDVSRFLMDFGTPLGPTLDPCWWLFRHLDHPMAARIP